MQYVSYFDSPMGRILLAADEVGLTGLWFEGQKYFPGHSDEKKEEKETAYLKQAKCWLTVYFSGKEPDFAVPVHLQGTDFQMAVWKILQSIPYGQTMTYGEIAKKIAAQRNRQRMSAQAVGGAVGHNPISIIVPCHRVVGADGSLTGYAGGIEKKVRLLTLEKADMTRFFVPKKGTAL
ncbi:MAG: methylated-DNA--[protein]-cysteine S-methyltransferase [Clostridiales bacterium]|nr:methylated-DNA--[protein]-cysteine S-methyltransferase [Clostridiales bacterium]MCD8132259.1 methylated-DNA--[protein]-cysteine S-methyltransferase [Clostridiales bacterium]